MAKKKPQDDDKPKKGSDKPAPRPAKKSDGVPPSPQELVDLMNEMLQRARERLPASKGPKSKRKRKSNSPEAALIEAQELVHEAYETDSDAECFALAQRALQLSPDCVDAYVLLGELAPSLTDALAYYDAALAAGKRVLGEELFQQAAGHFWGMIETRPYMRALLGKAQVLWAAGRRDDSHDVYREMLRLNPGDNQGVRYLLTTGLLESGHDQEVAKLQKQFHAPGDTEWAFNQVLLLFRQKGDTPATRKALTHAQKCNKHVASYLLGYEHLPEELPEFISPGKVDEAIGYSARALGAWKSTPGAITWLREASGVVPPLPPREEPLSDEELAKLPSDEEERWQADVVQMPANAPLYPPLDDETGEGELWALFVSNPVDDQIVAFELLEQEPDAELAWEILGEMMFQSRGRPAHRPGQIEVRSPELHAGWTKHAEKVGIELVLRDELEHLDELVSAFADRAGQLNRMPAEANAPPPTVEELLELDQNVGEIWLVDWFRLPMWLEKDGTPQRPWTVLVLNPAENMIVTQRFEQREPTAEVIGDVVLSAMRMPVMGQPHRPERIEVRTNELQSPLADRLRAVSVDCEQGRDFSAWDACLDSLASHLAPNDGLPALFGTPGLTPEKIASFYQAAAAFYRARPWQRVPGDLPLKIEVPQFQSHTWYAVVMGQQGMSLGLALYDDKSSLEAAMSGVMDVNELARRSSSLAINYGEAFDISQVDLFQGERRHWELAGPEAYPIVMRLSLGQNLRSPLAWELQLLEACLRALIVHLQKGYEGRQEHTVETAAGPVKLTIEGEPERGR